MSLSKQVDELVAVLERIALAVERCAKALEAQLSADELADFEEEWGDTDDAIETEGEGLDDT